MKIVRLPIVMAVVAMLVATCAYAVCYIQDYCTCALVGGCYGQQYPENCDQPTCVIADSTATSFNVCQGAGPFTGRTATAQTSCCPSACRIYNNCTMQYETPPQGCCFMVVYYEGVGSKCQ